MQATYDTIEGLLESKAVELNEADGELKRIAEELRGASKKPSGDDKSKKLKARRPSKQRERKQEETEDFSGNGGDDAEGGILQTISSGLFTGFGLLMQHKAVVAFGIASYAIYAHGEAVSVQMTKYGISKQLV